MDISNNGYERILVITELIKIVTNGKIGPSEDKIFNALAITLKENLNINCQYLITKTRENGVDENLAALSGPLIKDLKKFYQIYSKELKQIYKTIKNQATINKKSSEAKKTLKISLSKTESLLFAYTISGNEDFLNKQDNNINKSLKHTAKEATRIPQKLIQYLVPEDEEIISKITHSKTKTPGELALKYCTILFDKMGYGIGGETFKRTAKFKLPKLPEIEISDDEILLFKEKIRSSQNTSMRNPTMPPNVLVPKRVK